MSRWGGIVARLNHREPATALAAFRIATAAAVWVTLWPPIWRGTLEGAWVDAAYGGMYALRPGHPLSALLTPWSATDTWGVVAVALVASVMLAIGWLGRFAAAVTLMAMVMLFSLDPAAGGGHDRLHTIALFLVVLAPSTTTLSVDCRRRTGAWTSDEAVFAWPRYLVIFQLCLMYFSTGIQKASLYWTPMGDFLAVYYALLKPLWMRFPPMDWVGAIVPLTQIGTVWTWVFETFAPVWIVALYFRATRTRPGYLRALFNRVDLRSIWALMGLALHGMLWFWMELGPFQAVTLAYYTCLFHPDEYAAAWRRWRR